MITIEGVAISDELITALASGLKRCESSEKAVSKERLQAWLKGKFAITLSSEGFYLLLDHIAAYHVPALLEAEGGYYVSNDHWNMSACNRYLKSEANRLDRVRNRLAAYAKVSHRDSQLCFEFSEDRKKKRR